MFTLDLNGFISEPVWLPECQHTFCQQCIGRWFQECASQAHATCPVDNRPVWVDHLVSAPRIVKNLISRLRIRCSFEGCNQVTHLADIYNHEVMCEFEPSRQFACETCSFNGSKLQLMHHNCAEYLKLLLEAKEIQASQETKALEQMYEKTCIELGKLNSEFQAVKTNAVEELQLVKRQFQEELGEKDQEIGQIKSRKEEIENALCETTLKLKVMQIKNQRMQQKLNSLQKEKEAFNFYLANKFEMKLNKNKTSENRRKEMDKSEGEECEEFVTIKKLRTK